VADRELELNSISRYSKQAQHLVLEEHSACEVPAGCRGVILRWRAPHDPVPVLFTIVARGEYTALLDGKPLTTARPLVSPGQHALTFRLARFPSGELVLMLTGAAGRRAFANQWRPGPQPTPFLRSLPDGTWRYVTQEPPDDAWMQPGYDDTSWSPMVPRPPPVADGKTLFPYWIEGLQKDGAQAVGATEEGVGTIWVRKEFSLAPDSEA
jgi:hypothetical protein